MLRDALRRAFDAADSLVESARSQRIARKAPGAGSGFALVASGPEGVNATSENFAHAKEQYAACREWVFACIRLIADRVAGQSIYVAREKGSGPQRRKSVAGDTEDLEPLPSHPILSLLADPNELMVAHSMLWVTVAGLELSGRAVWWVTHDRGRRVIMPIPTTWIEKVDAQRTVWTIRPEGRAISFPVPGEEIVHFYYPDPANPFAAMSPLQRLAHAVETDTKIAESQHQSFGAIMPRVALRVGSAPEVPGVPKGERATLTRSQRQQLIQAVKNVYAGVVNQNEPLILDGLIEGVEKLSLAPSDLDYLNSSKITKARICQGYGVSPILLGEVEGANRASATVADEIFVANKINPLLSLMSQTMTEWLGPMFAANGERLRVWIEPAVPRDEDMRLKRWQVGMNAKAVTVNEFRKAVLGLKEIDGGDVLPQELAPQATPEKPEKPSAEPVPVAAGEQEIQTVPQNTLNGAQIQAAAEIVQAVARGEIPRDSGIGQLEVLLNLTNEQAEKIMGQVGNGFVAPATEKSWIDFLSRADVDPYTMKRLES